ncbi:MAG: PP0621 family protein [Usitatibacter sp.]
MGRIVLLLIIGFVVYLALRGFFRAQTRGDAAAPRVKEEDIVACARCGVHLPRSEARNDNGALVCRDNPRCGAP